MSEYNIFSYNHSSTNKSANLGTMKLLLVLYDAHNPINNPTARIADLHKQNTLLPGNPTADRPTISPNDGYICSYHNDMPFQECIPRGIMVGA